MTEEQVLAAVIALIQQHGHPDERTYRLIDAAVLTARPFDGQEQPGEQATATQP